MTGRADRAREYIGHMLDSVRQILTYTAGKTFSDFESDRLIQDGVIRNLEVLGEASRRLLDDTANAAYRFPRIPFAAIYAMRNQLSHGYFTIDLGIVWKVVERDIPFLKTELEHAFRDQDDSAAGT